MASYLLHKTMVTLLQKVSALEDLFTSVGPVIKIKR